MSAPSQSSKRAARADSPIRPKIGHLSEILANVFAAVPLRIRRRRAARPSPTPASLPTSPPTLAGPSHIPPETTYEIVLKKIKEANRFGVGGFGTIAVLEHPTKGVVAMKQLQVSLGQGADDLRRRTLREAETWQELKHPCVLAFLGTFETPTALYLISPFVKNGALDSYLRRYPDADRRRFLHETAGAIVYLHECGVVHGDIKASNILVSDDVHALLCDFGLARSEAAVTSIGLEGVGTVRFQSPELLTQGGGKTFANDAWAFGMTIYEVLSGNIPYYEYNTNAVIFAITIRNARPPKSPSHSPLGASYDQIWNVADGCWNNDPLQRMSMQDAHTSLGPEPLDPSSRMRSSSPRLLAPDQRVLQGHTSGINCLAFSPDGTTIVSGSADRTLRLWDAETGISQSGVFEGHENEVYCVAFSPDGTTIISGSTDHTIRQWDVGSKGQKCRPMAGHTGQVYGVAISSDGKTIVSGSTDQTVRLWDAESGDQKGAALKGHAGEVYGVAFSPDGKTVVSVSWDRTVRLWDVGSQQIKAVMRSTEPILCVAFSPDGRTIASGHQDCVIRLWDVESQSMRHQTLKCHSDRIWSVAFSSDSRVVVSGSDDHTIRLWDAESGAQRGMVLKGHMEKVWAVAFSLDDRTIASGALDHTLRLWNVQF